MLQKLFYISTTAINDCLHCVDIKKFGENKDKRNILILAFRALLHPNVSMISISTLQIERERDAASFSDTTSSSAVPNELQNLGTSAFTIHQRDRYDKTRLSVPMQRRRQRYNSVPVWYRRPLCPR